MLITCTSLVAGCDTSSFKDADIGKQLSGFIPWGYTSPNAGLAPEVVEAAGERLRHEGIPAGAPGTTDREFDAAIRTFQVRNGIEPADGKLREDVALLLSNVGVDLTEAARRGNASLVTSLIQKGSDPNAIGPEGWPPLLGAVAGGNIEIVRQLLSAGADINRASDDDMTAILLATLSGDRTMASMLHAHGADATRRGPGGLTAVDVAARAGDAQMASLLRTRPTVQRDAVPVASSRGDVLALRAALAAGAPVDAADSDGWTGLMYAVARGDSAMADKLLAAGASPDRRTSEGFTPLHLAAWRGDSGIVRLLLSKGADSALRDRQGSTAALIADANGHRETANVIVSHSPREHEGKLDLSAAERSGIERLLQVTGNGAAAFSESGRQAIRNYQSSRGLAVTGYINEIMMQKLSIELSST